MVNINLQRIEEQISNFEIRIASMKNQISRDEIDIRHHERNYQMVRFDIYAAHYEQEQINRARNQKNYHEHYLLDLECELAYLKKEKERLIEQDRYGDNYE